MRVQKKNINSFVKKADEKDFYNTYVLSFGLMYFLSKVMVKSASCRPNNKPLMFVILGRSCFDKINWSMSNMILLKAMAKKKKKLMAK